MKRSRRLEPIQRVAGVRERHAARDWAEARRAEQDARERLDALRAYLDDYCHNYEQARAGGLEVARLLDYQRFIARLQAAIDEQRELVEQHVAEARRLRGLWEGRRVEHGALDKVATRLAERERDAEQRAEQREQDDRRRRDRGD